MAQKGIPKFGNWDNVDNVPYTQHFKSARKGKIGGKLINPNDPAENPEAFLEDLSPAHNSQTRTNTESEVRKSKPKLQGDSREDSNYHKRSKSPLNHKAVTHKGAHDSADHCNGDRVTDPPRSNFNPHYHAKKTGKGASVPSWEKKVSSDRNSSFSPKSIGRPTPRHSAQRPESPEIEASVPKSGKCTEANPTSSNDVIHIPNKVWAEKDNGPVNASNTTNASKHKKKQYQESKSGRRKSFSCFGSCNC